MWGVRGGKRKPSTPMWNNTNERRRRKTKHAQENFAKKHENH
jgi:hypothetical protein